MNDRQIWYLCDPEKNTACRKTSCRRTHLENKACRCMLTSKRDAAIRTGSGKAVLVVIRRTKNGFLHEVKEEGQGNE